MKTTLNLGLYLQKDLDDKNMQLLYKMQKHYTGNKKRKIQFCSILYVNLTNKFCRQIKETSL